MADIHQSAVLQNKIHRILQLDGMSLATSGSYRNFYEKGGKRYSHTINPKSGRPIEHFLMSISVLSKSCMTSDALAPAMMVMGPEKSLEFAKKHDLNTYMMIKRPNSDLEIKTTGSFGKYLVSL